MDTIYCERLPRHKRAKDPPAMRLQPRDLEILITIGYEYRYLTARQVHILFFGGSMSQTRLRLTKLYHNGYLERVYRPAIKGSAEAIYCLDKKGVDALASEYDVDRDQLFWQGRKKTLCQNSLEHALRVNDFRVAINSACVNTGVAKLAGAWVDEQVLREANQRVRIPNSSDPDRHIEYPIVADGFFGLEFENSVCQFFMLEVDMGTESNRRFGAKVKAYKQYLESGKYGEVFEQESFKVLVATTSQRRAENLMRTARESGDKTMFWFTDFSQYTQDGELMPDHLMERIWQVTGDWFVLEEEWRGGRYAQATRLRENGRRRSLIELAGVT